MVKMTIVYTEGNMVVRINWDFPKYDIYYNSSWLIVYQKDLHDGTYFEPSQKAIRAMYNISKVIKVEFS